jgi:WD40 repeat protein
MLATLGLLTALTAGPAGSDHVDRLGDALPEGAVARLGTARLRHGASIQSIAYAADGSTLASAAEDGSIFLWDPATGKRRAGCLGHEDIVYAVTFSPDAKVLASASKDGTARIWDARTGKELHRFAAKASHTVRSVAFSTDGRWLIAGTGIGDGRSRFGGVGAVCVWEIGTWRMVRSIDLPGTVVVVAVSPDGTRLAVATDAPGPILLFDPSTGEEKGRLSGPQRNVFTLAFSPSGKFLAAGSYASGEKDTTDVPLIVWDLATGKEFFRSKGDNQPVTSVAFSPDGKTLAGGTARGTSFLWELATGKERRRFAATYTRPGRPGDAVTVAFAPDGKTLATASYDRTIRFWDPATGAEVLPLAGHRGGIDSMVFAPDGRTLVSAGGWEGVVHIWDTATGEEIRRVNQENDCVPALAYSPDGKYLAVGDWTGSVSLREAATDKRVREWQTNGGLALFGARLWIDSLCFSPDGRLLACGRADGTSSIWNLAKDNEPTRFQGE